MANEGGALGNYKKVLLDSDNDELIWFEIYQKISEENPSYPECIFPTALYEAEFASAPLRLRVAGMGEFAGPTIPDLMRKIIKAYEEVVLAKWRERRTERSEGAGAEE